MSKANEWGVLASCAWSAMRALDYLEEDNDLLYPFSEF